VEAAGDAPALARGATLGRFMILGLVGRGAMGEVYSAYDPELDRKIAIKLVRADRSGSGADTRSRLMREAQATAKISHPNVIVVYDVGTVEDRVFIAMEFVDGHTLRYWAQSQRRAWSEIMSVFLMAGRGLAAAHERELVHRDFKPDNVMVDKAGHVRVMDFGLARLAADGPEPAADAPAAAAAPPEEIDVDATAAINAAPPRGGAERAADMFTSTKPLAQDLTQTGAVLGTPAYMAPEQFDRQAADARSDQFSYCVALWEALYETRPFAGRSFSELEDNVKGGRLAAVPAATRVPSWVHKALARGLSRNPADRFPSMSALLAELDRLPSAGRTGFERGAAAKLAGVWEAPVDGLSVDTPEKAEMRKAFLATDKPYAEIAFSGASAVLDRYATRWTELYVDACEATHVRGEQSAEVLDRQMAYLFEGLENLRALCRLFREATGEVVQNAVSAATALGTLERCQNIELLLAVVRPPEDPATRAAVAALRARLAEVRALWSVGRYGDAARAATPVTEEARRIGYAPTLAEALLREGFLHVEHYRVDAAAAALQEALWTAEEARHDEVAAEAAIFLVSVMGQMQGKFEIAEIWCRCAETILRRMGKHELLWGWYYQGMSVMRYRQGRLAESVADAERAIEWKQRALGATDPDVGVSWSALADSLFSLGEYDRALDAVNRAIEVLSAGYGPDHPRTAISVANLGEYLSRLGRFRESREPALRALQVFERETGPDSVLVSYPLLTIGLSHLGTNEPAAAIPVLERSTRIREANEVSSPAVVAEVHLALGRALADSGVDRERGRALVARARLEFERAPRTPQVDKDLGDLDRWLAATART